MVEVFLIWGVAAIVIGLGALATIFRLRSRRKGFKEADALQTLSITLVVLGIIFGDDHLIGYSFIGVGVLLSIISVVSRRAPKEEYTKKKQA